MKRLVSIVLILVCIFSLSGCGKNDTYKISITVPAGTAGEFTYIEDFIYSDEEISPIGDTITVCLLYTSPSPRDLSTSRMPSSA